MKTSIGIYSTDVVFRTLFEDYLAQHFPCKSIFSLGQAGRSIINLPVDEQPDLIFVDFSRPNLYSKIRLARLKKICPEAELVVLVREEKPAQIFEFIQAGASAYLVKEGWQHALPHFLAQLEEQKVLLSSKVARYLIEQFKCQ